MSSVDNNLGLDNDTHIMGDGSGFGLHGGSTKSTKAYSLHNSGLPLLECENAVVLVDVSGVHQLRVHCC